MQRAITVFKVPRAITVFKVTRGITVSTVPATCPWLSCAQPSGCAGGTRACIFILH